jgi:heme oxygenase
MVVSWRHVSFPIPTKAVLPVTSSVRWQEHRPYRASAHTERSILSSPIQSLRLHTHSLHAELENTALARDLLSPSLTLARYTEILRAWAEAWIILEDVLQHSEFALIAPELVPAARGNRAIADLRYLGQAAVTTAIPAAPRSMCTPSQLSGFLGICYVVRGASLGGKVIAKHLATTLGLGPANGAAFFAGDAHDALTWVQWMRHADALLLSLDDVDEAKHAAGKTFRLLTAIFSRESDNPPSAQMPDTADRPVANEMGL